MGAGGVALGALAAHADGGEFGKTASLFLIVHAAALVGLSAQARIGEGSKSLLVAGFALAAGAILFSGDLAARAFFGGRLFPFAAPIGGSLMILVLARAGDRLQLRRHARARISPARIRTGRRRRGPCR